MAHHPMIVSLHPKWASLVLDGRKTIEVRRRFARPDAHPNLAFIYATGTVGAVVGVVRMTATTRVDAATLNGPLASATCIPPDALDAYLGERSHASAITLDRPLRLCTPVTLSELRAFHATPPQLFTWPAEPLLARLLEAQVQAGSDTWRFGHVALDALADDHPIFAAPRALYAPGFDPWLAKCRRENRPCYGAFVNGILAGLAITAPRNDHRIKLCMFHTTHQGAGLGGFLMDRVLASTKAQGYGQIYGEILRQGCPTIARFFTKAGFVQSPSLDKACSHRITLTL